MNQTAGKKFSQAQLELNKAMEMVLSEIAASVKPSHWKKFYKSINEKAA